MKKLTFLFLLISLNLYSQTAILGDLENYINIYLGNIPGTSSSDEYQPPADSVLDLWGTAIENIINEDYFSADTTASKFGYRIVEFNDTTSANSGVFYLLEKTQSSTNFWGIFAFNPNTKRKNLVIEAPHPLYDMNTGKQGFSIFQTAGARVLLISGAHRCNSSIFSTCSGTTTACSSTSQQYRISDQPHTVDGTFQKTTEVLASLIENIIVIQPHGFAKGTGDPDLIMSNGTQLTPATDYLLALRDNLLAIDNTLTFKIAHIDQSWTRLIATTNTQGRLINGSNNPCTLNSSSNTGRFLHIEQAYTGLRNSKTNWMKLANAIAMTFPEDTVLSVERNSILNIQFTLRQNYPNPFNPSTTIEYSIAPQEKASVGTSFMKFVKLKVYDILGNEIVTLVNEEKYAGNYRVEFDASRLASGIYFYQLVVNNFIETKKMILIK